MGTSARTPYRVGVCTHVRTRPEGALKVRVVAAVRSEGLARLLGHLLDETGEFEAVVGGPRAAGRTSEISRLGPDVIVVTLSCLGKEPAARIAELKAAHPAARLLVISPRPQPEASRPAGADAQVPEEAIVSSLVAEIRKLVRRRITG